MMKRRGILGLIMALVLVVGSAFGTYAWFTSNASSNNNEIKAGNLRIGVKGDNDEAFSTAFQIALNNEEGAFVQPGDVLTTGNEEGKSTITIKNTGNLNVATFGRFTLEGDQDFTKYIKITDYTVNFYEADGKEKRPADNFIVNEVRSNGQFATNLYDWVNGNGPLDIPGTAWDIEALKPGEYFTITFKFLYDTAATVQGKTAKIGYEVKATQVELGALEELNITGVKMSNYIDYLKDQVE